MSEQEMTDVELDGIISGFGMVEPYMKDAYEMAKNNKSAFIMLRKTGLGGSDSSIVLNVNPFKTPDDLIKDKRGKSPTKEELEIGEKVNVRKGSDLEPLILDKFAAWASEVVRKPNTMYRFLSPSCLTVNFDGVVIRPDVHYPVEAKFISSYAEKYWDKSKAAETPVSCSMPRLVGGALENHIMEAAKAYGIPAYYYTQVQQEMLGLDANFGYVAALFDREWEFKVFKVYKDNFVCNMLLERAQHIWNQVKEGA